MIDASAAPTALAAPAAAVDPPLAGRVAVVTGGSRGIGAAVARRLAADGADVVISYVASKEAAEAVASGCRASGVRADVVHADAAARGSGQTLISEAVERFGRLDVLVANAGIASFAGLTEATDDDFDAIIGLNVRGVFEVARAAAAAMGEGGRIITIGSVNATHVPVAGMSLYSMSKAAVTALSRSWARDLGPRGITVNCIAPGPVDTDMNPAEGPFAQVLLPHLALPRYGRAEEVADLAAFLAGPRSAYLTGAVLTVDGGFTV